MIWLHAAALLVLARGLASQFHRYVYIYDNTGAEVQRPKR
jgi:hypothetical protein